MSVASAVEVRVHAGIELVGEVGIMRASCSKILQLALILKDRNEDAENISGEARVGSSGEIYLANPGNVCDGKR